MKILVVQALSEIDYDRRVECCEVIMNKFDNNRVWLTENYFLRQSDIYVKRKCELRSPPGEMFGSVLWEGWVPMSSEAWLEHRTVPIRRELQSPTLQSPTVQSRLFPNRCVSRRGEVLKHQPRRMVINKCDEV